MTGSEELFRKAVHTERRGNEEESGKLFRRALKQAVREDKAAGSNDLTP